MTDAGTGRAVGAAALAVGLLSGCSAATAPTPVPPSTGVDGLAAGHADWVLDLVADGTVESADLSTRFDAGLLADGGDGIRQTLSVVRAQGPWQVIESRSSGQGQTIDLVLDSAQAAPLLLHSTVDEDGRAVVFWFGPAVDPGLDPTQESERAAILDALPASTAVIDSPVSDGRCVGGTVEGSTGQDPLPLASVSKLLVLVAVLDAVSAGTMTWADELVLDDHVRSLPAGSLSTAAVGTVVTVQDAVARVLTESDNTASDMLLRAVGPAAVQQRSAQLSGTDRVFWSTREVFHLGWGPDAVPPPVDGRARTALADTALSTTVWDVTSARWQDGLDWFLTPAQTCDLGAEVLTRWAELPTPVQDMVGDGELLLHKAGGAPGVVAGVWLIDGDDGPRVVTVQAAAEVQTSVGDAEGILGIGHALARGDA